MVYIIENIVAISVATLAAFAFGALWYSVLGKAWMAAAGLSADDIKPSPAPYIISFLSEFWMASILAGALILAPVEAGRWTVAFGTAFILWIGFVAPTLLVNNRYEGRSLRLAAINLGHWLFVLLIMAAVLRAIGVEGPKV